MVSYLLCIQDLPLVPRQPLVMVSTVITHVISNMAAYVVIDNRYRYNNYGS